MATTIGTIELIATIDTSSYKRGAKEIEKSNSDIESSADSTEKRANKSFSGIAKVGLAAVAAAAVAAGAAIVSNIGNAVKRVDTLNNFPKVMGNLGYGADEARKSINDLDMGVRGLPTSLDGIASALQNIAPGTDSLDEATKLTLALNNALVAGGKDAGIQASAMEQFSQAIAKGRPDMMEWRSIAAAMPGQLKQISNSLGFKNWQQMAQAVTDGEISFKDVQKAIVSLNEKGLGELPSFADQARNATDGLNTGWVNMQTAITRGIGDIIQTIGSKNISGALSNIGKAFETTLSSVGSFIKFISDNKDIFGPIAVGIGAVVAAMTAWKVITTAITIAQAIFNAVLAANPIMAIITLVIALVSGLIYFFTQTETGKAIWEGFVNFLSDAWENIKNFFGDAWKFIKGVWDGVVSFFTDIWNGIVAIFSPVIDWFKDIFQKSWNGIKSIFSGVSSFFRGIWDKITSIFTNIGTAIGNAVSEAFKFVINGIIGFVEGFVNTVIGLINGIIDLFNSIPGVPDIGKIGKLNIPRLADGAIVSKATLAVIGEGREPEAVIPLSKLDKIMQNGGGGGDTLNITVNASANMIRSESDKREFATMIVDAFNQTRTSKGLPAIG